MALLTSGAVNKALASMLAFIREAQTITHVKRAPRKRVAAWLKGRNCFFSPRNRYWG
jgi:hypothetical protein